MKPLNNAWLYFLPLAAAAQYNPIQSALLDERAMYSVPIATNRVTTITFPGPIAAIDAAGVSSDPKISGLFQLAHSKGASFFSVRALSPSASANVNVRWGKHTYVFELVESPKPILSLILEAKATGPGVQPAPTLGPTRLLALLDKAKAFPLLKRQHPEAVAHVDFATFADPPQVTDLNDYEIRIEEAFRFNPEDTLVFHLRLRNKTNTPVRYRPESFSLRVGNRLYPQSISEASGIVPPKEETLASFAVTGTPDGARNELSLNNDFTVLVERLPSEPSPQSITNPSASTP